MAEEQAFVDCARKSTMLCTASSAPNFTKLRQCFKVMSSVMTFKVLPMTAQITKCVL